MVGAEDDDDDDDNDDEGGWFGCGEEDEPVDDVGDTGVRAGGKGRVEEEVLSSFAEITEMP